MCFLRSVRGSHNEEKTDGSPAPALAPTASRGKEKIVKDGEEQQESLEEQGQDVVEQIMSF
jgi:hypothetical protein